jgi:hypothetical protein
MIRFFSIQQDTRLLYVLSFGPLPPVFAHPLGYIPSQPWELSMQHEELGLSSRLQDELTVQDPSILSKK